VNQYWTLTKMYCRALFWIDPQWETEWYYAAFDKMDREDKRKLVWDFIKEKKR
jgi:hypothetical protein